MAERVRAQTERLPADAAGVARAAALVRQGGLVAFPTETVYGLGADARSGRAVAAIYEAKGRPRFNPLIVHVADAAAAARIGRIEGDAVRLARAFWPGPLTLVVPLRPEAGLSELVTAGLDTVGLRVPDAALARALLAEVGGPVAAPSANLSGQVSPTTAEHVLDGLSGRIAAVLDGGPCRVGIESTIVGVAPEPVLLRPGGLPAETLAGALGRPLAGRAPGVAVTAPGQLTSHYAPSKPLRLDADAPRAGELWLGFGPGRAHNGLNLSVSGDLREAAANLFAHLRALDAMDGQGIAVAHIPETGLGAAIRDRLSRAAAPRA
ncbi:MAG: L-threonylcarbamoyladenylate synthase [Paracoccaceae bacterium]|jgi:L-threonylcarbamoyladenylate synthase|nr:L-threonylcarbamoyladenylate synthase [Paracoccaceae bacterium]